jgi:hypothetical protein
MERLRALSEEECYLRCYGFRGSEDTVKILRRDDPGGASSHGIQAERIRISFEARLDAREPEAA